MYLMICTATEHLLSIKKKTKCLYDDQDAIKDIQSLSNDWSTYLRRRIALRWTGPLNLVKQDRLIRTVTRRVVFPKNMNAPTIADCIWSVNFSSNILFSQAKFKLKSKMKHLLRPAYLSSRSLMPVHLQVLLLLTHWVAPYYSRWFARWLSWNTRRID